MTNSPKSIINSIIGLALLQQSDATFSQEAAPSANISIKGQISELGDYPASLNILKQHGTTGASGILNVTILGTGSGAVTSSPSGINCGVGASGMLIDCMETFTNCGTVGASGTLNDCSVSLFVTPVSGSVFGGWNGGGCGSTTPCILTVDADTTIAANFIPQTVGGSGTLNVEVLGAGSGVVTSSPPGINCGVGASGMLNDCMETFINCGTAGASGMLNDCQITLFVTPASDSTFAGLTGGWCEGIAPCTLTVDADTTVTATFDPQTVGASGTLNLEILGAGSGTVTSSPPGINCGVGASGMLNDCMETFINCGTAGASGALNDCEITLFATPASDSTFTGWSGGGCSGVAPCILTVNEDITVAANFNPRTVGTSGSGMMPLPPWRYFIYHQ